MALSLLSIVLIRRGGKRISIVATVPAMEA